ncbi:MAG: EAL domain-containing protein [Actinobacteria bacterium]|nr:EAL domain-containing protein [Actinomycetota bacterium]MCA1720905.1 EAL domain-containing protein [Actinomycetota bacterium]
MPDAGPAVTLPARPASLRRALAPDGLTMLFQPVVDLTHDDVIGHEALVRGPGGGPLEAPAALFAAARAAACLSELDWACRAAAFRDALRTQHRGVWRLFVNAEPQTLNTACPPELVGDVARAHRRLNVVVELTERFLTERPADLVRVVATLRELGWEIAVDDAGANDASVALLPVVAPDVVKLDRPLLSRRLTPHALRTLRAITAYVERSGAVLLAEGIETEADLQQARSLGATWGQGFHLGRPEPLLSTPELDGEPVSARRVRVRHDTSWDLLPTTDPFEQLAGTGPTLLVDGPWLRDRLRAICEQAAASPQAAVLVLSLGAGVALPPSLFPLLDQLQDVCALVSLQMDELPAGLPRRLRATELPGHSTDRPLVTAAFLSPEGACGLAAVGRGDGRYDVTVTTEPDDVAALSRLLLSRVPARPPAGRGGRGSLSL